MGGNMIFRPEIKALPLKFGFHAGFRMFRDENWHVVRQAGDVVRFSDKGSALDAADEVLIKILNPSIVSSRFDDDESLTIESVFRDFKNRTSVRTSPRGKAKKNVVVEVRRQKIV